MVEKKVVNALKDYKKAMRKEKLKNFFKKVIVLIPFVIVIAFCLIAQLHEEVETNEYYRSAEVFRIENKVVYLEDTQGNVWCIENDTLKMFGRYILVMDNCGTDDITDDVILRIE